MELENPPLLFPCALIDLTEVNYSSNLLKSQQAQVTLTLNIANKLQNVSYNASLDAKNTAYEYYDLLEGVSKLLHGYSLSGTSPLCRTSLRKMTRQDGIKEYQLTFTLSYTDQL
ncbi:MAG: hypothetical protein RR132_05520 [Rikenellaceae bacterium]